MADHSPDLGESPANAATQSNSARASEGASAPPPTASGNPVASTSGYVQNYTSVHAGGNFYPLSPNDYLRNLAAIKSLLNEKNELQQQLMKTLDPTTLRSVTLIAGAVNVIATVLVGIGVNMATSKRELPQAPYILGLGIILTIISAASPILVSIYGVGRDKIKG